MAITMQIFLNKNHEPRGLLQIAVSFAIITRSFCPPIFLFRVNTHAHALVGIHTPLVRVGIQMKLNIRSYFDKRADVVAEKGKQCSVKFNIPDRKWDVWTVK